MRNKCNYACVGDGVIEAWLPLGTMYYISESNVYKCGSGKVHRPTKAMLKHCPRLDGENSRILFGIDYSTWKSRYCSQPQWEYVDDFFDRDHRGGEE